MENSKIRKALLLAVSIISSVAVMAGLSACKKPCEHTEVEVLEMKAATCTESGLTDGKKCSDCGKIIVAQAEIPALGHNETVTKEGKKATCTETGLTEQKECLRCEEITSKQEVLPIIPHNIVKVEGRAATCVREGMTDGAKCDMCGKVYTAQEKIPAKGHSLEPVAGKEATCLEAGWESYQKCTVDGCGYDTKAYIEALGHDYDGNACQRCGYQKSASHTCLYDNVQTFESTCETAGLIIYSCDCGERQTETVAAIGHDYESFVTTEASCLTKGIATYYCKSCEASYEESIEALGHDWVEGVKTEATCIKDGVMLTSCTRCKEAYETAINAKGHTENAEGVITKVVTCTEDGVKTFSCKVCNEVLREEITEKLGHDYAVIKETEGDCITNVYSTFECNRCKDSYEKKTTVAVGHLFENGQCKVCDESITVEGLTMDVGASLGFNSSDEPMIRFSCEATEELQNSLKENQVFGMIFIPYEVLNAVEFDSNKNFAQDLEYVFEPCTYNAQKPTKLYAEPIITYEFTNVEAVAIPVVKTVLDEDEVFQYSPDVAEKYEEVKRSAVGLASTMLNVADLYGWDDDEKARFLDIIDCSVDLYNGLEEPKYDGSSYVLKAVEDFNLSITSDGAITADIQCFAKTGEEEKSASDMAKLLTLDIEVEDSSIAEVVYEGASTNGYTIKVVAKKVGTTKVAFTMCGVQYISEITIED